MEKIFVIILILFAHKGFSQDRITSSLGKTGLWVPISFSGEFRTSAHYKNQKIYRDYLSDTQKGTQFSIGGLLKSKNYIWHKNFLLLDVEAEYNPSFNKENFIVIPDQAETRTMKRLNLKTTLFNKKAISLLTTTDLSQIFSNRENLTRLETNKKQFGGILTYRNKILPLTLTFNKANWVQKEFVQESILQGDSIKRESEMDQLNIGLKASKSFYSLDKHDFVYTHDGYLYNNNRFLRTEIISDVLTLNDNFYFEKEKKHYFKSRISYRNQKGNTDYNRLHIVENLLLELPLRLRFQTQYNYNRQNQEFQNSDIHDIKTILSHKLFLSLNTNVSYEYKSIKHSAYAETYSILGGNVYYTKKMPMKSRVTLVFNHRRQDLETINNADDIQIFDENYILTDGEILMLPRPYVDISSIVIRDITGSIIYQENLDYILIERNNFIEIQRFPGGQIANGIGILVDYVVQQPNSHGYVSQVTSFTGRLNLFYNILEIYFSYRTQDFINVKEADLLTLNYYSQYQYGALINFRFAEVGFELDNYYSTIVPYKMARYYINFYYNFHKRVLVSINSNLRDYYLINEERDQSFVDVSGKIAYRIFDLTRLSAQLGYRQQVGTGIDLQLFTSKIEVTSQMRKLFYTVGVEKYNKNFLGNINNYEGIYFRLMRKF